YKKDTTHATQYYAHGEHVPVEGVIPVELRELMYRVDKNNRRRVLRSVYECGVFQTLRDKLRCKEIWVAGADRWRNPDEDLPADFGGKRTENYRQLGKPVNPKTFTAELREEMHTPNWRRCTTRYQDWTGCRLKTAARAERSSSPHWTPSPNLVTCADSRPARGGQAHDGGEQLRRTAQLAVTVPGRLRTVAISRESIR
ncbi:MAG: hypothetical protein ACRDU4_18255, partial [Mycobacterium sp.]